MDEETARENGGAKPGGMKAFSIVWVGQVVSVLGSAMAQFALKWILMHDAVSCTIPGAKRPAQVEDNCRASDLPDLSPKVMEGVRETYGRYVKADVHHRW